MRSSRGMGAIRPELKKPRIIRRKDGNEVEVFAQGGGVNAAGNYTKPGMRKALFNAIKSQATQGTAAGL